LVDHRRGDRGVGDGRGDVAEHAVEARARTFLRLDPDLRRIDDDRRLRRRCGRRRRRRRFGSGRCSGCRRCSRNRRCGGSRRRSRRRQWTRRRSRCRRGTGSAARADRGFRCRRHRFGALGRTCSGAGRRRLSGDRWARRWGGRCGRCRRPRRGGDGRDGVAGRIHRSGRWLDWRIHLGRGGERDGAHERQAEERREDASQATP
jgi:hypothetical protein